MGKKVNWSDLHERLKEIFGPDEEVVTYESGDYKETEIQSQVLKFLNGEEIKQIKPANIVLLAELTQHDYDSYSQGYGLDSTAVFSLEQVIYKITVETFSYSGTDIDNATAEEVAPKIKQIIYYD